MFFPLQYRILKKRLDYEPLEIVLVHFDMLNIQLVLWN